MRKTLIILFVIASLLALTSCNKVPTTYLTFNITVGSTARTIGTDYYGSPDNILVITAPAHADSINFYVPLDSDEVHLYYKMDPDFFGEDFMKFATGSFRSNGTFKKEAYFEYIIRRPQL